MPRNYSIVLCLLVLVLTGCGKFDVYHRPAAAIEQAPQICIIESSTTRYGFLQAMESWLDREGVAHRRLTSSASLNACPWVLTYSGRWSWDIAIFLADAEITAYNRGKQAGTVQLRVGQFDAYKFEEGEVRVHKLMDLLYAKTNSYAMPAAKNTSQENH